MSFSSATITENATIKVKGDGACVFRAFIVGLRQEIGRLEIKNIQDVKGFLQFLTDNNIKNSKGQPYTWPEFRDYFATADSLELQKQLSPVFRKYAIKRIREDVALHTRNKEFTTVRLQAYFDAYIHAKINGLELRDPDDVLDEKEFPFIKDKFEEVYKTTFEDLEKLYKGKTGDDLKPLNNLIAQQQKTLTQWWDKQGHPQFLTEMENVNKWAGDLELEALGKSLGVDIQAGGRPLIVDRGEFQPNPQYKQLLIEREVISRDSTPSGAHAWQVIDFDLVRESVSPLELRSGVSLDDFKHFFDETDEKTDIGGTAVSAKFQGCFSSEQEFYKLLSRNDLIEPSISRATVQLGSVTQHAYDFKKPLTIRKVMDVMRSSVSQADMKELEAEWKRTFKQLPAIELVHEAKSARNKHWDAKFTVPVADLVLFNLLKVSEKEFTDRNFEPVDFAGFLKNHQEYNEAYKTLLGKGHTELAQLKTITDKTAAEKALQALVVVQPTPSSGPSDKKIPAPAAAATPKSPTTSTPTTPTTPSPAVGTTPPSFTTAPSTTPPPVVPPTTPITTSPTLTPSTPVSSPTTTPPPEQVTPPVTTPPPAPKTPVVAMSPEEKKLRQASLQTTRDVIRTLIKSGTVGGQQARTAITSTKQSAEAKAATLRAVDLPKEANQFRLPKGVGVAGEPIEPQPALVSSLEKCYTLKPGETKTFEVSDGAAKGCKYKSEFKNNTLTTKVESFTDAITQKHTTKITGDIQVPSKELFAAVDKLLFDQVLNGAGHSANHKVHIQIEPKDDFHKRLIDAFVLLCEEHKLQYQNDTANLYQPFSGGAIPAAVTTHVATLVKEPEMNQHEHYDAVATNTQIEKRLNELKTEATGKPGNFEQKIDAIQKMYDEGIKKGRVDSSSITKLLDDLSQGLTADELKEIDTKPSASFRP